MKCIRCGSEMSYTMVGITADKKEHPNWYCDKCKSSLAVLKIKMLKKKRLNNVLSKFKKVMIKAESGNLTYLYQTNNDFIAIGYYEIENHFKLLTNIPSPPIISLNTVESLIKDLENEN